MSALASTPKRAAGQRLAGWRGDDPGISNAKGRKASSAGSSQASGGRLGSGIGAGDERQLAAAIREICPSAVDLVGRTDLATVGALAQRAALTVGNDTGVTHLAAAAGSPVVVLFSSATDPDWCAPRGRKVRVLAVPDLADDLTAEAVIAAARETLGATMVAAGTGG